ncbi:hypothetical protein [Mesorhizobium tianshanense]|uniref:Uncharacterized protein n=1 Tax=Mesorhizobium tianshanense TaxID=39844 RepID=A0A562MT77_9HYPH|nr:hypothetical protein [Mesorhizobium tianshanense]TWI23135.1 hypothetical protein IQ26_06442 [Mesorhizobium tianshanense]
MDRLIARANIAHFQDLLAREADPKRRRVIEDLLALEQKKLKIANRRARKQSRQASNPNEAATRLYRPEKTASNDAVRSKA